MRAPEIKHCDRDLESEIEKRKFSELIGDKRFWDQLTQPASSANDPIIILMNKGMPTAKIVRKDNKTTFESLGPNPIMISFINELVQRLCAVTETVRALLAANTTSIPTHNSEQPQRPGTIANSVDRKPGRELAASNNSAQRLQAETQSLRTSCLQQQKHIQQLKQGMQALQHRVLQLTVLNQQKNSLLVNEHHRTLECYDRYSDLNRIIQQQEAENEQLREKIKAREREIGQKNIVQQRDLITTTLLRNIISEQNKKIQKQCQHSKEQRQKMDRLTESLWKRISPRLTRNKPAAPRAG